MSNSSPFPPGTVWGQPIAVTPPWAQPAPAPVAFNQEAIAVDPLIQKYGMLDRDAALTQWQASKDALQAAKDAEIELRKYVVMRAFPDAHEGMNKVELGNGFELKAGVKFNYGFGEATNEQIDAVLLDISKVGNLGSLLAERLVSWSPNFLLTEYRMLEDNAALPPNEQQADLIKIKTLIDSVLVKKDAAPSLEIKEPSTRKRR